MSAIVDEKLKEVAGIIEAFGVEDAAIEVLNDIKEGSSGCDIMVHIPAGSKGISGKALPLLKGSGIKSMNVMGEAGQFLLFKGTANKRGPRKSKDVPGKDVTPKGKK